MPSIYEQNKQFNMKMKKDQTNCWKSHCGIGKGTKKKCW